MFGWWFGGFASAEAEIVEQRADWRWHRGVSTGLDWSEIALILVIGVIVFRPSRLSEAWRSFRQATDEFSRLKQSKQQLPVVELRQIICLITALLSFAVLTFLVGKESSDRQILALLVVFATALVAGYYAFIEKD